MKQNNLKVLEEIGEVKSELIKLDNVMTDLICKYNHFKNYQDLENFFYKKGLRKAKEILKQANWDEETECSIFGKKTMDKINQKIDEEMKNNGN